MGRKDNLRESMKDGNSGPDPLSVLPTASFIKWEEGVDGNVLGTFCWIAESNPETI